jgi:serine phosphatase RsbU (regulator of sigma subunit)/anti-sigma regulatory factor (Ser/Thr protein kinase)/CHASE3 domain sensor protein
MKPLGLRQRTLLLTAVPLGFLVLLLASALFLQWRNAIEADESRSLTALLSQADQAAALLDKASRSVLAFDSSHRESDLQNYDLAGRQLPATLAALARLQQSLPRGRAAELRFARALTQALDVVNEYLGYARTRNAGAKARLASSPRVRRLSVEIVAARNDFNERQRALTLDRLRVVRRQIAILTGALIGICVLGIVVTVLLALRFGVNIAGRVTQLAENARRLAVGEEAQHISGNDEIAELDLVYREMMRRTKREHDMVTILQRALLPQRLPVVAGVRLDACYVPAYSGADVGGDWYDVFSISDRLLGVSVGDVAGHGLRAATVMGQGRQALRTASHVDDDPATALGHVNRLFCRSESSVLLTAFFATLDLSDGRMRYALAGHPPPMMVRTGGEVESLPGRGLMLGIEPRAVFATHELMLDEGSAIVLFTDGLVEMSRDYIAGREELRQAIEAEYRDASQNIAQAIVKRVVGGRSARDDIALLFLCVTALAAAAFPRQRMHWTIDARSERSTRRIKRALLWQLGEMTDDDAQLPAVELIVNELLGNVARHTPGPAEVELEWNGETAIVRVSDRGRPFQLRNGAGRIELLAEDGRGLFLARSVALDLTVEWTGDGNCVSATLPLKLRTISR